jgi:hypothetical protein
MFSLLEDGGGLVRFICGTMFDEELMVWATRHGKRSPMPTVELALMSIQAIEAAYTKMFSRTTDATNRRQAGINQNVKLILRILKFNLDVPRASLPNEIMKHFSAEEVTKRSSLYRQVPTCPSAPVPVDSSMLPTRAASGLTRTLSAVSRSVLD